MNTYVITEVSDRVRDWSTRNGAAWKSYRVTLRNKDGRELGNVEISRVATAPPPKTGETVEGTVEQGGAHGPKLQEPRRGGGGGRAKPPEERRSIAMQSSNQRGVEVVRIAVDAGLWKPETPEAVTAAALKVADEFFARVMKAEAGA